MRRSWPSLLALLALAGACSDGAAGPDAGAADAGEAADGAAADGAPAFPRAGFGAITGDCDVLDDELVSAAPAQFLSHIRFDTPYTDADLGRLTPGGQEIIADDNAGGSSLLSEVFAYELLERCELAALVKTETEIVYDAAGAITDFSVDIDGERIGVSVTRAVAFPFGDPYPVGDARALLEGKLADILVSSANVSAADSWRKQILAVLAYDASHADALRTAAGQIDGAVLADTILWVVVTDGSDDFIYCDGPCT